MTVFAKGAWYALADLCETKYNTIGLDWLHAPAEAYKVAQAKGKVLQGNADPGVLYGSRESITKVVEEMVAGFGGGKQGWIANLGHGMLLDMLHSVALVANILQASPRLSSRMILSSTLKRSTD